MRKIITNSHPLFQWINLLYKPAIILIIWTTFIFLFTTPSIYRLNVGDISENAIVSPRTALYVDRVKTDELKKKAEEMVLPVYSVNPFITQKILASLNSNLEFISQVRNQQIEQEVKIQYLVDDTKVITREEALLLLNHPEDSFKNYSTSISQLMMKLLEEGIRDDELGQLFNMVISSPDLAQYTPLEIDLAAKLIAYQVTEANYQVDQNATELKKQEAKASVSEITGMVFRGDAILRAGEVVTERHLEILETVGLFRRDFFRQFNFLYFLPYLIILAFGYQKYFQQKKLLNDRYLNDWVWILASFLVLLISYVYRHLPLEYHFLSVVTAGILIGVTTNYTGSIIFIYFTLALFVLIFPLKGFEILPIIVGLTPALVYLQKVRHRTEFILLGGVTFILIFVLNLPLQLYQGFDLKYAFDYSLRLAGSCAVPYIISMVMLPFFERYLKVLTPFRLLELAGLDQQALKNLLQEAPGTYHHSQLVATLSEHAAGKINADSLLCRVGGLYHDLGKISHPLFYNENQANAESIHQKISPSLSARVITNHAREGVNVGNKYRLPRQIIEIINSHHGTYLASYFFQEASMRETYPREETYRYPGPKPDTKEKVIVMLADACEAAVRSLSEITTARIKETVEAIIKERNDDGQFVDSEISFKELSQVQESLINDLLTLYHSRIDYGKA